jgi:uncharacterized membrane protein YsdA (DUF1294 family)/cold shock CspA family protein
MRLVGRITEWNDARGFGFVVPNGGGERAFVHIKAFDRRGSRPFEGAIVSYGVGLDDRKRPQALAVRFAGAPARPTRESTLAWRSIVGCIALLVIVGGALAGRLPAPFAAVYFVASALAFAMYGIDKSAARNDCARTPENTLHLISLCGGWPGALLAQDVFRHKSRKVSFQAVFWFSVVANLAIAVWLSKNGFADLLDHALQR